MGVMTHALPKSSSVKNETITSHFLLPAILGFVWLSFGISTFLNNLALYVINHDLDDRSVFPTTIGSLMWLIAGIWISGYVGGFVLGLLTGQEKRRSMIASAVVGYEFMVLARLTFLNAFPLIKQDAFEDVFQSLTLDGVPGHLSFFLLSVIFGTLLVWLAVYTGYELSRVFPRFSTVQFEFDARLALSATILPATLLLSLWSLLNLIHWQRVEDQNIGAFTPFTLVDIEVVLNPALHMIMAAIVGILIGLSPYSRGLKRVLLSTGVGALSYVLLVIATKDIFVLFASLEYEDNLNFGYPNLILFTLLWLGPVFTAVVSAFAFYNIRLIIFGNPEQPAKRKEEPLMVIQSEEIQ